MPVLLNEKLLISPNPALEKVNIEFLLSDYSKFISGEKIETYLTL